MNSKINTTNLNSENKNLYIDPQKSCCFTGHRIIRSEDVSAINHNLPILLKELYKGGINTFIAGGALGFDTIAALEVIKFKAAHNDVRLILALPCKNQTAKWNYSQKQQYAQVLNSADEVIYISDAYLPGCMQKRNRFMVDNSNTVIVYIHNASSGTGYTAKYALDKERRVINILTYQNVN